MNDTVKKLVEKQEIEDAFRYELSELINKYSKENGSNTPDFILADYLGRCLVNFDLTMQQRVRYFHRDGQVFTNEETK